MPAGCALRPSGPPPGARGDAPPAPGGAVAIGVVRRPTLPTHAHHPAGGRAHLASRSGPSGVARRGKTSHPAQRGCPTRARGAASRTRASPPDCGGVSGSEVAGGHRRRRGPRCPRDRLWGAPAAARPPAAGLDPCSPGDETRGNGGGEVRGAPAAAKPPAAGPRHPGGFAQGARPGPLRARPLAVRRKPPAAGPRRSRGSE